MTPTITFHMPHVWLAVVSELLSRTQMSSGCVMCTRWVLWDLGISTGFTQEDFKGLCDEQETVVKWERQGNEIQSDDKQRQN